MNEDFNPLPRSDQDASASVNLLFPRHRFSDSPNLFSRLDPSAWHDLGIEQVVAAFTTNKDHQKEIQQIFTCLIQEPVVLRYRLEIIDDLLRNPELVERLTALLPALDSLAHFSFVSEQALNSLHEVTWRIGELQNIVDCIEGIGEVLKRLENRLKSEGFRDLGVEIHKIRESPVFQKVVKDLPDLLAKMRSCVSITIGVNLDARMRPVQATLLSIHDKPFTSQSLLTKLFGKMKSNEGLAPLHTVPPRVVSGQYAFLISPELGWAVEPMMVPLFADLAKILEKTTLPVANKLKQYSELQSQLLISLLPGLIFYLGAVRFIQVLQNLGLPVCRPEITPSSDRVCLVRESYNVNLALYHAGTVDRLNNASSITKNDIPIGPGGRILILTGPNQGGKTTYMQGVGIVQVLAQVGCFVPGTQAQISPVDNILSHFPLEEKPETEAGRFGEETMRMGKLFEQVTRHSLVLLNESLSSTNPGESLYLAQDIVRILRRVGVRAIYSTHLHELGNRVAELNQSVPGDSVIISLVSSPMDEDLTTPMAEVKRTYKIETRPPLGQSYAREIAARYGISYEQLEESLSNRGVL
jgi:DNA mismatch repair protein MutS